MTKPDQSPGAQSPGDKDALGGEGAEAREKPMAEKKVAKKTTAEKKASTAKASPGAGKVQGERASERTPAPDKPFSASQAQQPPTSNPGGQTEAPARPEEAALDGVKDLDAIVAEALRGDQSPGSAKPANLTSVPTDEDEMTKKTPTEDSFYLDMGDLNAIAADELTRVVAERDEYLAALQRLKADFDNNRKRTLRQQTEILERANQSLLTKLLPVLDALDLAIAHASDSSESDDGRAIVQIGTLLRNTLATEGLERIDAVDTPFDPTIHDAVAREPAAEEDGARQTVSNVLRAGYKLKGRVIRPAMVMVRG